MFKVGLRSLFHLFVQKHKKNCNIVIIKKYILLQFKITVLNVIYSCGGEAIFSIITPVFSVKWSEIILICNFVFNF